jgi:hypothetical protein
MSKSCKTCPFFNGAPNPESEQITQGECRARPPVTHMLVIPGANGGRVMGMQQQPAVIGQTVFPTVAVDCWCGWHPERKGAMFG